MNDVWPIVHSERDALIDDLAGLDARQWLQQSLCEKWTVHDVVAHLIDSARTTRVGFVAGLARARFNFDRQNERGIQRERGTSPTRTLQRFRQLAVRTSTPPAHLDSRLVEQIVHGEDIGPEVASRALSLLLAVSGRRAALADLDGPGTALLIKV